MGVEIQSDLWRVLASALARVCVRVLAVIVQIRKHLAQIAFGSSWLAIVFVKP